MTTSRPADPAGVPGPGDERKRRSPSNLGWGGPALTAGVIAVGTCWLGWPGLIVGVIAVVLGFIGSRLAFHDPERSGGAALGGLALGLVGAVVGGWLVVPALLGVGTFGEGLSLDQCMAQANGQQEQRMCATQHLDEYQARYPNRELN